MAAACKYFDEDAVYRLNRKGNLVFGLVLENSEFVSSDEEEEKSSKDDEWERVKKGHVRVAWHPRGDEEVLAERKVYLADRSLMPGDVVRRVIKGRDTQRGYCRNVDVRASVQVVGTRQVIYNINSKDLTPLEEFSADIAVFLDSWVGMVKMVKEKVTLKCSDGSRCMLSSDDACDLDDIMDKRDRGSEFKKYDFYPGQQLWGPLLCFDNAEWIHTTEEMKSLKNKPSKNLRVTVEEVKVVGLGVHWQCRAYSRDGSLAVGEQQQPKYLIQGDDLKRVKMLNVFEPCTLQLGDRNYYRVTDGDLLLPKDQWRKLEKDVLHEQKLSNGPASTTKTKAEAESESNVKAIKEKCNDEQNQKENMQTERQNEVADANDSEFEDVDENEGNTSDSASISSRSSLSSAGHGGKKLKKRPTLVTKVLKNKKLKRARRRIQPDVIHIKPGDVVVVETLSTLSKAEVVWQDGSVELDVPSTALYPIHHLDDQEFFPGDFVVENKDHLNPHDYGVVRRVDHSGRTALVQWMKTYTEGCDPNPISLHVEEVSVYDLKDHPDFKYRPGSVIIRVANFENEEPLCTAGQVLDVHPSGLVEVSWVNTQRAFCYPQDLYKVGEYDSDEGELWDDGEDSDDSWETESELSIVQEETSQAEPDDSNALRCKLASNIENARSSMARLEEIFIQNPALQTASTMKQILQVYKDCKYLDRLMGSTFFHEAHFQGLLEKVRVRGRIKSAQRVAEQVSRLFRVSPIKGSVEEEGSAAPAVQENRTCNGTHEDSFPAASEELKQPQPEPLEPGAAAGVASATVTPQVDRRSANICAKLCSLLKIQLLKAHEDVMKHFGGPNGCKEDGGEDSSGGGSNAPSSPRKTEAQNGVVEERAVTAAADVEKELDAMPAPVVTGTFSSMETTPDCHKFKLSIFQPTDPRAFFRSVRKEIKLLGTSLPEGIIVKGFEDRMDLFSVMIRGPAKTPYEDGLFFFDLQLSADYPKTPPTCHYISYCSDRLNPNLYEDGKVCISLLGTWGGKGTEVWTSASNLLQIIVSIQGLILVSEPYFNEAGYERQKGTQQGRENSRMYNEMVVLKLLQAMTKLIVTPPEIFQQEILEHFQSSAYRFIHRLEKWLQISEAYNGTHPTTPTTPTAFREIHGSVLATLTDVYLPEFPLIPASKGFCITLHKTLDNFSQVLAGVGITDS